MQGVYRTESRAILAVFFTNTMLCGAALSTQITTYPVLLHCLQAPLARQNTSCNFAAGLFVTSVLGSVFRAVLTVSRTAFIWAFDVALYYSAWSYGAMLPCA